jgi:hypothetical protein
LTRLFLLLISFQTEELLLNLFVLFEKCLDLIIIL